MWYNVVGYFVTIFDKIKCERTGQFFEEFTIMDGYKYEKKCARKMRWKGFRQVELTKGSGDQGIDIIGKKGRKKYGIQCKYYKGTVGNKAVQQALSGIIYYDLDVAVVMTNSTFTRQARELAEKSGVLLWEKNKVGKVPEGLTLNRCIRWLLKLSLAAIILIILDEYKILSFGNMADNVAEFFYGIFGSR